MIALVCSTLGACLGVQEPLSSVFEPCLVAVALLPHMFGRSTAKS